MQICPNSIKEAQMNRKAKSKQPEKDQTGEEARGKSKNKQGKENRERSGIAMRGTR